MRLSGLLSLQRSISPLFARRSPRRSAERSSRRTCFVILVFAFLCGLVPGSILAADTSYRDPRQPSFSPIVPDGWTLSRNDQGVKIDRGTSWVQLFVQNGVIEPGAMLVEARPQFERQWKGFRELTAGTTSFGGQKGAYAVYAGVPPSGVNSVLKMVTMTNGHLTYLLFMEAHADEYDKVRPDMDRIQAGFAPDAVK